jgi:hypothetical protein
MSVRDLGLFGGSRLGCELEGDDVSRREGAQRDSTGRNKNESY